jgi:hypothetical protein
MLWLAGASQAAPSFSLSGGSSIVDVANDFLWIDSNVTEGGTLALTEPGRVRVEYIGKEAGFAATEFWFGALAPPDGTFVVATNSGLPVKEGAMSAASYPPPGITRGLAPYEAVVDMGTVPFYFRVPANANAIVPNGGSQSGMGDIAFWWKGPGALQDVVYVLLDDSGGFNPGDPSDNDHDDMVVRLTALPIPEPAEGALTLLGLLGLAIRARRLPGEGRVRL